MILYLVVEGACSLNEQIAIDAGCDMAKTPRLFKCYGWGFQVTDTRWLPEQYHGDLKGFNYLTPEQQSDLTPYTPKEEQ